jgi:hypothetical protein
VRFSNRPSHEIPDRLSRIPFLIRRVTSLSLCCSTDSGQAVHSVEQPWGLPALRTMMADARLANPEKFAHVRRELGLEPGFDVEAAE